MALRALARVNLAAIERNVIALRGRLDDGAELCAVVKADASGHGAVPVARAALAGGADDAGGGDRGGGGGAARRRAVRAPAGAGSRERRGASGRAGGERRGGGLGRALRRGAGGAPRVGGGGRPARSTSTSSSTAAWAGWARATPRRRSPSPPPSMTAAPGLRLAGAMTHLATADGDLAFAAAQLEAFAPFAAELQRRYGRLRVHAANSAGTLRVPGSHFDMVRCGIALYGCDPMNEDPDATGLEQAMELSTYVAAVKRAERRGQRRLRPPVHRAAADVDRHDADRLRRRRAARADQQLRRAHRRPPLPAGRHREHGQHHRRSRRRRSGRAASARARS